MRIGRLAYRLGTLRKEFDLLVLLSYLFLTPFKTSYWYYLGFAVLICLVTLRHLVFLRTVATGTLARVILIFNLVMLFSSLFSPYHFKSFLFVCDLLLISLFFMLQFYEPEDEPLLFHYLMLVLTMLSLAFILNRIFAAPERLDIFFENPIHQGIIAGAAVLIGLHHLLRQPGFGYGIAVAVNITALFLAASKAAYIGTVVFALLLLIKKRRRLIGALAGLVLFTIFVPNPLRSTFIYSLKEDPYAFDRILIWRQAGGMFLDNWLTGTGAGVYDEISKQYNFPQEKGPARYYKVARSPHNDYVKIVVEAGIAGLIFLLFASVTLFRLVRKRPNPGISPWLLFYLLSQALLFNILFTLPFFFLLLFTLTLVSPTPGQFVSVSRHARWATGILLVFIFWLGYLAPVLAEQHLQRGGLESDPVAAGRHFVKAERLAPGRQEVPYGHGRLLFNYYRATGNAEALSDGILLAREAQRRNCHYLDAYLLEYDFYVALLERGYRYTGIYEEALALLQKAQRIDPFNPFLRLRLARILDKAGYPVEAEKQAGKALELEPDYLAAIQFLHRRFSYLQPDDYQRRLGEIREKADRYNAAPDSYLDRLWRLPVE